jgi:hypothetical protein
MIAVTLSPSLRARWRRTGVPVAVRPPEGPRSPDNDVWTLRWRWREVKLRLQEELL